MYEFDDIHLDLLRLAHADVIVRSVGHVAFDECRQLMAEQPVSFLTAAAHVSLSEETLRSASKVELSFRTTEAHGLIMYSRGAVGADGLHERVFAVLLLDEHLFVALDAEQPVRLVKVSADEHAVNDGRTHALTVARDEDHWTVVLDDVTRNIDATQSSSALGLGSSVHLGGVKSSADEQLLQQTLPTAMFVPGFVGCVTSLRFDDVSVDLALLLGERQHSDVIGMCEGGAVEQCVSAPCRHGGACAEGWTEFSCDCASTGFTGPTCDQG